MQSGRYSRCNQVGDSYDSGVGSPPSYHPRIVDEELRARLAANGAVLIEGPKACGKTATARQLAKSEVRLDIDEAARLAAAVAPEVILQGERPRLLDEWQVVPSIWDHVRRDVEDRRTVGLYILTGSAEPTDDITRHSGAGRISRLQMRPMTLSESGFGTSQVSFASLLSGEFSPVADPGFRLDDVTAQMVRGGWPGSLSLPLADAARAVRDYLGEIARTDVKQVMPGVRVDVGKVGRFIRAYARHVGTQAAMTTISGDTEGAEGRAQAIITRHTAADYHEALTKLKIIEDQPAWAPHLRSSHRLRVAEVRHFVDPSLAVAALRTGVPALMRDLNLLGFLFESMVVRDLRVYAQAMEGGVLRYRDHKDLEVDAIVELPDGRWSAFEIKLGGHQIEQAAAGLKAFMERVDTAKSGEPQALGVITATGYAYRRGDGIYVIPIGMLGP